MTLGRQEEIKPLGQPGQYVRFPFTSLPLPFWTENELSLSPGEIVKDFQVRLSVVDDHPLSNIRISAPVIGLIAQTDQGSQDTAAFQTNFNMSEVEQYHYFGTHGVTGDLMLEFDVARPEKEVYSKPAYSSSTYYSITCQ